ncbi:periplasmic heavy metal sensor [Asticcacaulis sp. EMRT-3]|uniref:periplasmic heavy metal sensor n=1 Tax=Asticcacaulis sp. EMRT-3 TaxID=3040349 RepID=UPI0024AEED36|nr:periplasmic heavy metal sensor [Asticcacaulis sp. EMRT-3]MDI7775360.1 periplasmic heavy metal sensor [Asticcacaulis sp. EMRT-3]
MTARKWKWALGVSVAVNIFLLAVIGGGAVVIRQNMHHYEKAMRGINAWRAAIKELTPAERDQVFGLLKSAGLAGEDDMARARTLRLQASQIINKAPYDATQAAILSEQARNAEDGARCKIENALIVGMKTMSPKERAFISSQVMRPSLRFGRLGHPPQKPVASSPQGAPQHAEQASQ